MTTTGGKYIKYPRTFHLPGSEGTRDDLTMENDNCFLGREVVATIKMDGENTSMYTNHLHARSIDTTDHGSRHWVKGLHGRISYEIPTGMRLVGENLYAKHSIHYQNLPSFFLLHSVWKRMRCVSWDETLEIAEYFDIPMVHEFYRGVYYRKAIDEAFKEFAPKNEGYVVRLADSFHHGNFSSSVGKYVKPEFRDALLKENKHWLSGAIMVNNIAKKEEDATKL